ncbi:MAG: ferrous iron transport protein A [Treponema sp.]|jgi:ferrous iron transport protein A|nr:ferrous iron transport protein A [Treponema sp.]
MYDYGLRRKKWGCSKTGSSQSVPLAFQSPGRICRIKRFCGGPGMKRHLDDLGLISGDEITVLAENGGGLIVSCKGVRLAMNRGLAQHIMTETIEEE